MCRALLTGSCTIICLLLSPSCRLGYESLVGAGGGLGLAGATPGEGGSLSASDGQGGPGGVSPTTGGRGSADGGATSSGGQTVLTGGSGGTSANAGGSGGLLGFAGDSGDGGVSSGGVGGGGSGGGPAAPYCEVLPHLGSAPVIDGVLDGGLSLERLRKDFARFPTDNPSQFLAVPDSLTLRFVVAWHESGLYFYVEVADPDRYPAAGTDEDWKGDAIEFYVDSDAVSAGPGSFDDPGARAFAVEAPPDGTRGPDSAGVFLPFVDAGDWSSTNYLGVPTADGYVIEAFVDGDSLGLSNWSLQAGDPVAFDLGHDFSFPAGETGSEGYRMGQYFLQVVESGPGAFDDYPFFNTQVYCKPVLSP